MNERVVQFRVGVVVVAATIITGIMIMLFGEIQPLIRQRYTVYLLFPQAPGVTVDTPVRKHGVLIGRVSEVELRPEGGVLLTTRIDAERRLRKSDVCVIKTTSLLGDAVLEFIPTAGPAEFITDGETIADGIVASNPLEVITQLQGNIETAIVAIEGAASEIQQLARGFNDALGTNDDQFGRIMDKSELALDRFTTTMASIDSVVGDPEVREGLRESMQRIPQLFDELDQTLAQAQTTMNGIDTISLKAQRNLDNLENFTRPLGERGEALIGDIADSLGNLNAISEQLVTFSEALNSRGGTLGRLLYEPQLYDSLDDTLQNLNRLSRRLEPIIDDARVFADKIARDPRQLGIKGALNRKPLGVGF